VFGLFRRARFLLACAAVVGLATACQTVETPTYDAAHPAQLTVHALTVDGADRTIVGYGVGYARIDAPATNIGTNSRVVFWPVGTVAATDQQACATWSDASVDQVQQGLALRVRQDADGRFRVITVMKNVLYGAVWQFNVLTWDNHGSPTMSPRGAVNLEPIFRPNDIVAPLPWKICAKAVGDLVTLKAWRGNQPEPAWGDPAHGGSVHLPSSWVYPGKSGWYVGHIPPGGFGAMTDLRTSRFTTAARPTVATASR
jgi:hypothetical protein